MSPEEFDNRLRSSFNDEFVPPKEHLWHNINTRLDQQAKRPVWHWLAPVAIVAIATLAWLGNAYMSDKNDPTSNTSTSEVTVDNTPAQSTLAITKNNNSASNMTQSNQLPESAQTAKKPDVSNTTALAHHNAQTNKSIKGSEKATSGTGRRHFRNNNRHQTSANSSHSNNGNASNNGTNSNNGNTTNLSNISIQNNMESQVQKDEFAVFSKLFFIKRFKRNFSIDLLSKAERTPTKWPELKQPGKGQHSAEDMAWGGNFEDNKWWLNFGFGNQVAFNSFHGTYDSATKNKIHKKLIENEEQLTHNGSGSQIHLNIQNKFGKGNRFSFETGINYSFRTEDIKMNEQTYDIAARNNNEDILNYLRLKLFIAVGTDTTFFDATQSFALVTKNKYSIITVPLRFQYEQPLNRNTFISLGIGGGASIVRNKSTTHYDMVKEKEFQNNNSKYLTASLNTMLSIYTNYNGIGQFGVYGGYQMYLTPFKVNEQYGVRMSDLQFGVILRRPLDLK